MLVFYEQRQVPVHSCLIMPTRQEAIEYPKGDIVLGFCRNCGFIANVEFDPRMHEYSPRYEETQGFSPTFNAFHRALATRLIEQYDLYHKDLIEIGCGKGEFLTMLCELGENRGVGFDPAYISERNASEAKNRITFINDFYSEKYATYQADFVCCKMTLEHIQCTGSFICTLRRAIGDSSGTLVFFQVPDVRRILRELAFWDIYYEHCSYFSLGSLARVFRQSGFGIIDLTKDYNDQYLMITAKPGNGKDRVCFDQENDLTELAQEVTYFSQNCQSKLNIWKYTLQELKRYGRRAVLWGGGSKGVAFLTTLNIQHEIEYVVDINPYKQGRYVAGTGQKIVAPIFLQEYKPDVVIVMNPIYCAEIRQALNRMGLVTELMAV
jgi:SAM-dependent methyltransferase